MKLIPAIDLKNGRCVRLLRGDFDAVTDYSDDALGIAAGYAALGARYLHIVDLDGAQTGVSANREKIRELLASSDMAVQVGGGIRDAGHIRQWLDAGVSRVVVGSAAIEQPAATREWLNTFGADRLVLALDVRLDAAGTAHVTTHGWTRTTDTTVAEAIGGMLDAGLRHVLCTDVDRDGAMNGPNVALYRTLAAQFPTLRIQASGGISCGADLQQLAATGVSAAISGKALLENALSREELAPYLPAA